MPDMSDQLPSKDDLLKLSLRGMVCYALRSAVRVAGWTKPYPQLHKASMTCIEVTTRFCLPDLIFDYGFDTITATDACDPVYFAIDALKVAYDTADADADATATAVNAAIATLDATHAATRAYTAADDATARGYAADVAARAADYAARAAADAASAAKAAAAKAAARADFEKLLELTGHQAGQRGDPIDPGEDGPLGPLWPKENQELLKAIEESDPEPVLTVYFDESSGLTPENELLFLKYLNALYQEQGGIGLKIISDKQFQYKEAKINVYR